MIEFIDLLREQYLQVIGGILMYFALFSIARICVKKDEK